MLSTAYFPDKDERTEDEKMIERLMGKADAAHYDKAKTVLESVLALKPGNTVALSNLGSTWDAKGEYDKAIGYYEKALKSDLKTFGEDHPDVATYRNNLGMAWNDKGEYDKAIEYYEKSLKGYILTLSKDHPWIAIGWNNLGMAWNAKGEYDKAIEYFEKALLAFRVKLGKDHPHTKLVETNLSFTRKEKLELK